jgi:sugar/nucleoside kinase (ribokinase family)
MDVDILTFGNVSLDVIRTTTDEKKMVGGAILHAAWVGAQLGVKMAVLTKTAAAHKYCLDEFPKALQTYWVESKNTTGILNVYKDASMERRDCFNQGQADKYRIEDFPPVNAKIIQYSALMVGEVDLELIKALAAKGQFVLDAAGVIRTVMPDKTMQSQLWPDTKAILPYVTYFKVDAAEANFLTGIDTETHEGRMQAGKEFLKWGSKEIILTHNKEFMITTAGGQWFYPFKNRSLIGRTGRGDTSTTTYICERVRGKTPQEAAKYAAALTSLKMETPGPFKGTRADVDQYIDQFYN